MSIINAKILSNKQVPTKFRGDAQIAPRNFLLETNCRIIYIYMNEVPPPAMQQMPLELFVVLYEAAEAENRLRDIGEAHRVERVIDKQLVHEIAKLAARGADVSLATPLTQEKPKEKTKEA